MIQKASEQKYENEKLFMILYGLPGVGKTTLAASAPKPIVIDCDRGMKRVNPEYRCDISNVSSYKDLLEDIKSLGNEYETIVIDTGGSLIELMKEWAMDTEPTATKKNGGFSLPGYGFVKSEFLRLSAELRKKYNTIFIFHAAKEKQEEEFFYDLIVEGAAKTLVWQPADLGAYFFIQNGKRYMGFSPTANYSAKSAYGISGIVEVPELSGGEPNVFLTKLFEKVRANIKSETEAIAPKHTAYESAMSCGRELIAAINRAADVEPCLEAISNIEHALSSEKEIKALLKERLKELGITYNKETKTYEDKA